MKTLAIRFKHFVKTIRRHDVQDWLDSNLRGDHVFDSGGWRDRAIGSERGVEFECEDDAHNFVLTFGGEYKERRTEEGVKENEYEYE
jgi:hypothetical protein